MGLLTLGTKMRQLMAETKTGLSTLQEETVQEETQWEIGAKEDRSASTKGCC